MDSITKRERERKTKDEIRKTKDERQIVSQRDRESDRQTYRET